MKTGDQTFELTTDENGRIQTSTSLEPYDLTVRGKTFTAHALPAADHADEDNTYQFVLEPDGGTDGTADGSTDGNTDNNTDNNIDGSSDGEAEAA